jgi:hypothetical protein
MATWTEMAESRFNPDDPRQGLLGEAAVIGNPWMEEWLQARRAENLLKRNFPDFAPEQPEILKGATGLFDSLGKKRKKVFDQHDGDSQVPDGAPPSNTTFKEAFSGLLGSSSPSSSSSNTFLGGLLGAADPLDPLTPLNAGPVGMMGRALNDPTLDTGSKIGAAIVGLGSLAGPFAPITMLGSIVNALGGYHSFDPQHDKDLTLDINSGRLGWSGLDYFSNPEEAAARMGGIQYGSPNNLSTLLSAGDETVNVTYTTPDGTVLSGPVSAKTLAQEYATGVEGMFGRGPEALMSGNLGYDDTMDDSASSSPDEFGDADEFGDVGPV